MDKAKRTDTTGKVYKPQGFQYWRLVLGIAIFGIYLLVISSLSMNDDDSWIFTCFFLPISGLVIFTFFVQAAQTSLTVYEDGLEYRQGGSRLFATWQDMSHLGRRGRGKYAAFGILLHHKIQPDTKGSLDRFLLGWSRDFIPLNAIVWVPTRWDGLFKGHSIDLDKFANTEFGRDLMHYASHLFEKGKV